MASVYSNNLKKLKRKILNYSLSEILFALKLKLNITNNLNNWQSVHPDNYIANLNNITVDRKFIEVAEKIHLEKRVFLSFREMYNLYSWVKKTNKLDGEVAEVGVMNGGSAKLISLAISPRKKLYLFDTFKGIPNTNKKIDRLSKGDFNSNSLGEVKKYLGKIQNAVFCPGLFPKTARKLINSHFSFVHLDADLYASTYSALKFFYPRLVAGGVILAHDYHSTSCPGVKLAFKKYFKNIKAIMIELWDTQVLIIKSAE